jgi:hypothetical protein
MPYVRRIVCLANSFKIGGNCIAGKEKLAEGCGDWVRPVSARETAEVSPEECRFAQGRPLRLLDIIDVPLLKATPERHQTENHLIDTTRRWVRVGTLPYGQVEQMCDHPSALWANGSQTKTGGMNNCISTEQAAALHDSLLLIRPEDFLLKVVCNVWDGKSIRKYWGGFKYNNVDYCFRVTDPVIIKAYRVRSEAAYVLRDIHICVSLTEPFKDGRCHKLVAAVLSARPIR